MDSAAAKRQRLRRLKKQLATIESLLEEDSAAATAAAVRSAYAWSGGRSGTRGASPAPDVSAPRPMSLPAVWIGRAGE